MIKKISILIFIVLAIYVIIFFIPLIKYENKDVVCITFPCGGSAYRVTISEYLKNTREHKKETDKFNDKKAATVRVMGEYENLQNPNIRLQLKDYIEGYFYSPSVSIKKDPVSLVRNKDNAVTWDLFYGDGGVLQMYIDFGQGRVVFSMSESLNTLVVTESPIAGIPVGLTLVRK